MKIIQITCFSLPSVLLIRVDTDEGIFGWGECSPMNVSVIVSHIKNSIAPIVIGRNPFDVEAITEDVFVKTYKIAGQTQAIALSGIEIALWDIMGKYLKVPIYKLLGGAYRKKIRMYASSINRTITPEGEAERMEGLIQKYGFTGVKLKIGKKFGFDMDASPGRSVAVVKEVRKRLGDNIEILVDANSGFTAPRAIQLGRMLEEYNIFHFEEPCQYNDIDSNAKVAQALDVPVALGEQEWDIKRFKEMMLKGAADIVQPDIIKAGGFTVCKKIAALADAFGCPCTPHQTKYIGVIANLHLAASTPSLRYAQEYNIEPQEYWSNLIKNPVPIIDGYMAVPEEPGLGIELNQDVLDKAEVF